MFQLVDNSEIFYHNSKHNIMLNIIIVILIRLGAVSSSTEFYQLPKVEQQHLVQIVIDENLIGM